MGDAVDRDVAVPHGLQQGGLSAGWGAVEFIGEDEGTKEGTRPELEGGAGRGEDLDAGDVGRHQVRSELDAGEAEPQRASQGVCQGRLADAWNVFQQQVATGHHTGKGQFNLLSLASHHFRQRVGDANQRRLGRRGSERRGKRDDGRVHGPALQ
jgi:hypothetical protein